MKLKTLLLTTTLLATSAAFADASVSKASKNNMMRDFYVKAEAGVSIPSEVKGSSTEGNVTDKIKIKFKKGLVGGVGAGYTVNEFVRTDLMLQTRQADIKKNSNIGKGKVTNNGVMLNGYLTGHNDTIFTPYVMVGAGVGHNKLKVKNLGSIKKTGLIWNAGLGCQAKVTDQISLDLGYRYVSLGKLGKKTFGSGADAETIKLKKLASNEVVAGVVYNF